MTVEQVFAMHDELEATKNELEIYKKALEMACKDNGWSNCEYYLQKAREEV